MSGDGHDASGANHSAALKQIALTLVAFGVAPVLALLMIFIGLFSSPQYFNPVRHISYIVAQGSFWFGLRFMYLAVLFVALPLHLVLRRFQITGFWRYVFAGGLTGAIACMICWVFLTVNDLLRFFVVCWGAGFVGGGTFWLIAVLPLRPAVSLDNGG